MQQNHKSNTTEPQKKCYGSSNKNAMENVIESQTEMRGNFWRKCDRNVKENAMNPQKKMLQKLKQNCSATSYENSTEPQIEMRQNFKRKSNGCFLPDFLCSFLQFHKGKDLMGNVFYSLKWLLSIDTGIK